jgi:hypothetical protein
MLYLKMMHILFSVKSKSLVQIVKWLTLSQVGLICLNLSTCVSLCPHHFCNKYTHIREARSPVDITKQRAIRGYLEKEGL